LRVRTAMLPLFVGLPDEDVAPLLDGARRVRARKGDLLHREGERPADLHLLLRGSAELVKLDGQSDCGVMLLLPGDCFSLGAVLADEPYLTSARALGTCDILCVNAEEVRRTAASRPSLASRLLQALAGQWRTAVRHIIELQCRSAPQRLAAFLLRLVDATPAGMPTHLPVPKTRLAARLGIAPETLSRCLQQLSDEGLVVRGREVIVTDRARIAGFCGHAPLLDSLELDLGVRAL
jgi:CRP/FNR family transcriptional regulator, transcriptional activator FtrB